MRHSEGTFKVLLARLLSGLWPRFSLDVALDATAVSRDPEVVRAFVISDGWSPPRYPFGV